MDWFRWWHGSVTDPKLHLIADECECTRAEVIGVWAIFLEYASQNDPRGSITKANIEALSYLANLANFETLCNAMKRLGLLHETDGNIFVVSWNKRQPKRDRVDNSTDRVRAYRERKKQITLDAHDIPPCNASETPCNAPREDKIREEHIKPKSKSSALASRLPADWSMSPDDCQFCIDHRPDLNTLETASRFRDYWIAQPGAKGRKLDWSATWRNWVRNEKVRDGPRHINRDDERRHTFEVLTGKKPNERPANTERDITGESTRIA